MAGARRRKPGERWSAGHSVELYDADGNRLPDTAQHPTKVIVRWRYDGANKHQTFTGENLDAEFRSLRYRLALAYEHNLPADERGRPVALVAAPKHVLAAAAKDAADLVEQYREHMHTTLSKRGEPRSPKTLNEIDKHLDLIRGHLWVYPEHDHRAESVGRQPGASLVLHPELGLDVTDLVRAVDLRKRTNLRTRAANERAVVRWAKAVERAQKAAKRNGRPVDLPAPPEPKPETVMARTVEETCRIMKDVLDTGVARGWIDYQPWTAAVDDEVIHPQPKSWTSRQVISRDDFEQLRRNMAEHRRPSIDRQYNRVEVTGERYVGVLDFAIALGCRPEEARGARASTLIGDAEALTVGLEGGEVDHAKHLTGAEQARQPVPLKWRTGDEVRWVTVDGEDAARIVAHRDRYVSRPGHDVTDADDPHLFTTHWGTPLDFTNWGDDWWKPVVEKTFPEGHRFRRLEFRELRHAAITWYLLDGHSTADAAERFGTSQHMIEKHYKGVIAERDKHPRSRQQPTPPADIGDIPTGELAELVERARAELNRRLGS